MPLDTSAVLVTGTSTGIGRAIALRLAKSGTTVFAGVRRETDGVALAESGGANVRPIMLDVTNADSIARAVENIRAQGLQLGALVNNAGSVVAGPMEVLPLDDLRRQFELNFFGAIALTQAVLPLLRQTQGRIVNMSSIGGKLANPYIGAYSASKFALEAASDAMRVELAPWKIKVVVIEPGAIKTPIWGRASDSSFTMLERIDPQLFKLYEQKMAGLVKLSQQQERDGSEPELVAEIVQHVLTTRQPRARYLAGTDARVLRLLSRLPDAARDRIFGLVFARYSKGAVLPARGSAQTSAV